MTSASVRVGALPSGRANAARAASSSADTATSPVGHGASDAPPSEA